MTEQSQTTVRRASKRASLVVVLLVVFISGIALGRGGFSHAGADSTFENSPAYQSMVEAWDLIHSQYVDPESLDDEKLIHAATAGMVEAVGDTGHTTFLDPLQVQTSDPTLSGQYVGIGVEFDFSGLLPRVLTTLDGGPAEAAGILPGDVVTKVDGKRLDGLSNSDISTLIRGEEGTDVTLTIRRADQADFDVTLTRAKVTVDPVTWWMIGDSVAQIRLAEFSQQASKELRKAISDAEAAGATAFILDLRNNSGGLVTEAQSVGGAFLPEGSTMFQVEDRDGNKSNMTVTDGTDFAYPLVVLINQGTASAGEITAAAISEAGVGTTIGETTFGTGTVLSSYPLDDGSLLVLGTQLWLTPSGKSAWKVGVDPEIPVALPSASDRVRPVDGESLTVEQLQKSNDTQLQKGYEVLMQETGER